MRARAVTAACQQPWHIRGQEKPGGPRQLAVAIEIASLFTGAARPISRKVSETDAAALNPQEVQRATPERYTMLSKSSITAALACAAALAVVGGTAALASQAASAAPATAPAAAAVSVPRCLTQNLSAGLHGDQALVGNRGFILTLTNTGSSECSLYGYPGLGLQDASHHVRPSHTHWGGTYFDQDPGRHLIVLSPGETASADFAYFSGTGGSTDSVATYLEVTPPNDFTYLVVRIPGAPVRIDRGNLYVTAMARHTPYNT